MGGRGRRPQQAVDAHANAEAIAHRLNVYIARAKVDCPLQEVVDRAHHRRAAREIAEAVDALLDGAWS